MAVKAVRNRRRIRNAAVMTSVVVAAGLGCYFGSKRGFESIAKLAKSMEQDLNRIRIESENIMDLLESQENGRILQQRYINTAIQEKVPFQHFPGLGIRFENMGDAQKIDALLGFKD
jgi:hypothetical protein